MVKLHLGSALVSEACTEISPNEYLSKFDVEMYCSPAIPTKCIVCDEVEPINFISVLEIPCDAIDGIL